MITASIMATSEKDVLRNTSQSKITKELQESYCAIELNGEITQQSALALEKELNQCFGYYQYAEVEVKVQSQGGDVIALRHIVDCMQEWRAQNRKITTLGLFTVASAGAILMALGEVGSRKVHRYSELHFHHARIASGNPVTAMGATRLARILQHSDEALIGMVVDHLTQGFGGVAPFREEGMARCAQLTEYHSELAKVLGLPGTAKPDLWVSQAQAIYEHGVKNSGITAYAQYLALRFEEDQGMDLREAYCLGLLDQVRGVPAFGPQRVSSEPITNPMQMERLEPLVHGGRVKVSP